MTCHVRSCGHVKNSKYLGSLSRRGKREGFEDENSKPFFTAILTIKLKKPQVFGLECARAPYT